MDFQANKYNPETDPYYPKIGAKFDNDTKEITKSEHVQSVDLIKMFNSLNVPEDVEHLTVFDNPERPFLKYLVWWKEVVVTKNESDS